MSSGAVKLFTFLQEADFYQRMHWDAVNLLEEGWGKLWLDVGCGPGLLTRMASDRGYVAQGIDYDLDMVEAAQNMAIKLNNNSIYESLDVHSLNRIGRSYDVESASSLLVLMPDPFFLLRQLMDIIKPGGVLLIIEASSQMNKRRALIKVLSGKLGSRAYMLQLWASVRSGNTLSDQVFNQPGLFSTKHALLDGLVNAWLIKKTL